MKRKKAKMKNEKKKRMRRNDFGDGLMFDRSLWIGDQQREREEDRGGMDGDQKGKYLGGGGVLWRRKRERDPRRKEKERIDQRERRSVNKGKEP
jgi:hypothetical protein